MVVARLRELEAECQVELANIQNGDDTAEIERMTAEYKAKITEDFARIKAEKVAGVELEIKAINRLVARELEKQAALAEVDITEPTGVNI